MRNKRGERGSKGGGEGREREGGKRGESWRGKEGGGEGREERAKEQRRGRFPCRVSHVMQCTEPPGTAGYAMLSHFLVDKVMCVLCCTGESPSSYCCLSL